MKKLKRYLNYILRFILSRNKITNLKELAVQIRYLGTENGLRSFLHQKNISNLKLNHYHSWFINKHLPVPSELDRQKAHKFAYEPLISIIVPTYNTPKQFLIEMLESVIAQTYLKWELCIADGASTSLETLEVLREYSINDSRIKIIYLSENYHISGNTNQALPVAGGDYIGFFDHDDLLTPNCLFEYVNAINQYNKPALIYCDEDKVTADSKFFSSPAFKPDFDLDKLRTSNYVCHWLVVRHDILDKVGEFDSRCDGAQDYDMVLRVIDTTQSIVHIPKVLYHWRTHMASTAAAFGCAKPYTHDAGKLALAKHLERNKLVGNIRDGDLANTYKIEYLVTHE
jgi:glycosyltransferase involved in cell wall biosynthesis